LTKHTKKGRHIKDKKTRGGQALTLTAIWQARLERVASSASWHERMANGWAAASGEKRIELSETIAWFGDILNRDGPLVEIGPRPVFNNSAIGARQGSFGHALATGKDRWRCRRASRRRHREARLVLQTSYLSRTIVPGSIFPGSIFSSLICGPDGGKTPRKGVEKAIFWGIGYVAHNGATPVIEYS